MPNNWTLTEQAAIILKSYGVDDVEAARAVVALVVDEVAKYHDNFLMTQTGIDVEKIVASTEAIRALGDKT